MSDSVQFSILGMDELLAKLKSVKEDVRYKSGRFALRKAANLVRDAAASKAQALDDPATAANIEENLAVRFSSRRFKSTGDIMFRVGIMGGAGGNKTSEQLDGLPGKDTRHWRYIEFGTTKTPARPFMQPALTQNINPATDEFIRQYGRGLDRAIKRAKKAKS